MTNYIRFLSFRRRRRENQIVSCPSRGMCINLLFSWHCFPIRHRCATRKKERKDCSFTRTTTHFSCRLEACSAVQSQTSNSTQAPLSGQGEGKTFGDTTQIFINMEIVAFCVGVLPHIPSLSPRRRRLRNVNEQQKVFPQPDSLPPTTRHIQQCTIFLYFKTYSLTHFADCSAGWSTLH